MDIIDRVFLIQDGKIKEEYTKTDFMKIPSEKLNELSLRGKAKVNITVPEIQNNSIEKSTRGQVSQFIYSRIYQLPHMNITHSSNICVAVTERN